MVLFAVALSSRSNPLEALSLWFDLSEALSLGVHLLEALSFWFNLSKVLS
jgi:hypothetical protein